MNTLRLFSFAFGMALTVGGFLITHTAWKKFKAEKNLQHFKVFLALIEIFSELFLNFSILNSTFLGGLSMIFLGILMLVFSLWENFFLRLA
jgi:hypothetical protein